MPDPAPATPEAPAAVPAPPAPAAAPATSPINPSTLPSAAALDGLPGGGQDLMNSLAAARAQAESGQEPVVAPPAPSVADLLQARQEPVIPAAAPVDPAAAPAPAEPAAATPAPAPVDPAAAPAPVDPAAAVPVPVDPAATPVDPAAAPAEPAAIDPAKPADPAAAPAPASTDPIYEVDGVKVSRDELVGKMGNREFQEKVEKGEAKVGIANDKEMRDMFETQFAPGIESPIFGGAHKFTNIDPEKAAELQFEVPNELNAYVKENFGVDTFEKLTESIPGWRKNSQNFDETQRKVTGYEGIFKSMPNQLYQAVQDHFNGKEWKDPIMNAPNLDFNLEVKSHDSIDLVESYFGERISTEDWEAYSDSENENHDNAVKLVEAFVPEAENKYTAQKLQFDTVRATEIQNAADQSKAFDESIQGSAQYLKKQLPQAQEGYVDSLTAKLKSGDLHALFFEQDGVTLKEEALLNFAMAKDGFALYQQMKGTIRNQVQTAERQEILSRGADTPAVRGATGEPNAVRPELQQYLTNVVGDTIEKPQFYSS